MSTTYPLTRIPREHWPLLEGAQVLVGDSDVRWRFDPVEAPRFIGDVDIAHVGDHVGLTRWGVDEWYSARRIRLDIESGATRGVVLEVLRAVTGEPGAYVYRDQGIRYWDVEDSNGGSLTGLKLYPTEAEALIAALEHVLGDEASRPPQFGGAL